MGKLIELPGYGTESLFLDVSKIAGVNSLGEGWAKVLIILTGGGVYEVWLTDEQKDKLLEALVAS